MMIQIHLTIIICSLCKNKIIFTLDVFQIVKYIFLFQNSLTLYRIFMHRCSPILYLLD